VLCKTYSPTKSNSYRTTTLLLLTLTPLGLGWTDSKNNQMTSVPPLNRKKGETLWRMPPTMPLLKCLRCIVSLLQSTLAGPFLSVDCFRNTLFSIRLFFLLYNFDHARRSIDANQLPARQFFRDLFHADYGRDSIFSRYDTSVCHESSYFHHQSTRGQEERSPGWVCCRGVSNFGKLSQSATRNDIHQTRLFHGNTKFHLVKALFSMDIQIRMDIQISVVLSCKTSIGHKSQSRLWISSWSCCANFREPKAWRMVVDVSSHSDVETSFVSLLSLGLSFVNAFWISSTSLFSTQKLR